VDLADFIAPFLGPGTEDDLRLAVSIQIDDNGLAGKTKYAFRSIINSIRPVVFLCFIQPETMEFAVA
jgi:hypothetical protein